MDEEWHETARNPAEAYRRALVQIDSAVRGEFRRYLCELCLTDPCGCGEELGDYERAVIAKHEAYNRAVEDVLAIVARMIEEAP